MRPGIRAALALLILIAPSSAFSAGKNDGGAMLVHTTNEAAYTATMAPCGETWDTYAPATCEDVVTQADLGTDAIRQLVWYIAAFHPDAEPGVTVVYFGHDHNIPPGEGWFNSWSFCGPAGTLEVPDAGWPEDPGAGNSIALADVVNDHFFPFYWFAVYGDTGFFMKTGPNPNGGYASFVSDDNPGYLDRIDRFGTLRFYEPGEVECPVPPRVGACCLPDASCIANTLETECEMFYHGQYQGDNTTCDTTPCGACCWWRRADISFYRECVVTGEIDCKEGEWSRWKVWIPGLGDTVGSNWAGPGLECAQSEEEHEPGMWWCGETLDGSWLACCNPGGGCALTNLECWGDLVDSTCDPDPCPAVPGACCHPDGTCTFEYFTDCMGDFLGPDIPCDPNPCPQPTGACCFMSLCVEVPIDDCIENGGIFLGDHTDCSPNPCPVESGACCHIDGSCTLEVLTDCDGDFIGWGVPCDPNPCPVPTGACCFIALCVLVTEEECVTNGGEYVGDGVPCDPNPCPFEPERAACCIDEICTVLSEGECHAEGGIWFPDEPDCEGFQCPPIVIEHKSWGAIKAGYR